MMEIRRVRTYDGGNHLVRDELQYRSGPGQDWVIVEEIDGYEERRRYEAEEELRETMNVMASGCFRDECDEGLPDVTVNDWNNIVTCTVCGEARRIGQIYNEQD